MGSNSVEEGLILQIGNPSHLDPGRIAVPAGAVLAGTVFLVLGGPIWLRLLAGVVPGAVLAVTLYRRLERRARDREAARRMQSRADRQRAVARQLSGSVR